jgi:FKBP-type peptidyl-prolyl cis-trans isomerase
MKKRTMTLLVLVLTSTVAYAAKKPETDKEKYSYAIGWQLGQNIANDMNMLDQAQVEQGMRDAMKKANPQMTEDQISQAMSMFRNIKLQKFLREGQEFLAKNRTQPGVKETASGLQYQVITMGTGPKPGYNNTVVINYKGNLINGTVFDSSTNHGGPVPFEIQKVIPGWQEALLMMPVGSKWKIFIPSHLAYGSQGIPGRIPPNSVLIFEIELISVQ